MYSMIAKIYKHSNICCMNHKKTVKQNLFSPNILSMFDPRQSDLLLSFTKLSTVFLLNLDF